jgi:hypothetical protein
MLNTKKKIFQRRYTTAGAENLENFDISPAEV